MTSDDIWSVATAEDDGKPLILRIRNKPPSFASKKTFPYLLAVSWQYDPTNESRMPPDEVADRMGQLEDLLEEAFDGACQAFLSVIATGNGVREWQWYARDPGDVMTMVNQTLGELEPFPVEFSFQYDPDWTAYARFLDIL